MFFVFLNKHHVASTSEAPGREQIDEPELAADAIDNPADVAAKIYLAITEINAARRCRQVYFIGGEYHRSLVWEAQQTNDGINRHGRGRTGKATVWLPAGGFGENCYPSATS